MQSAKNLKHVAILTLFSLSVFAIFGMQMYMGVLTQKCVRNPDPNLNMSWDEYVSNYSKKEENWLLEDAQFILCGNSSWTRHCPEGSTCVQGIGPNPDYGYTTFDSFPWALLCAFRLMTHDFWESLYQMVLITAGPWHVWFFVVIILWCSFYLVYLIFAVVASSYIFCSKVYEEEEEISSEKADTAAAGAEAASNGLDFPDSDDCFSKKESVVKLVNMKDLTVVNDIIDEAAGPQSKESEREKDENEKPRKKPIKECCTKCTDVFCVWDCCRCWVRFQGFLSLIIFDPFMELFITLSVVANVLFMMMDHHDMEPSFERFLYNGNYFFTAVYVLEAVFKIIALSPKHYFRDGWNRFDFIIAALSIIELILEGVQGLSVLRAFRLLRAFKLTKSWPTLYLTLSISCKTSGTAALGNLTYILGIIISVFAVLGMQLFGQNYSERRYLFTNEEVPNWNFIDFFHSFMLVFRALCGEWIETMWDCLLVGGWTCIPFFLSFVVIGNIVVLNLFFAFVLAYSPVYKYQEIPSDIGNAKKLREAIGRFSRACQWLKNLLFRDSKVTQGDKSVPIGGRNGTTTSIPLSQCEPIINDQTPALIADGSQVSVGELNSDKCADNIEDISLEFLPQCCPDCCYACSPCCRGNRSKFWITWDTVRRKTFYVVEHKYFETAIITVILISSLALAAEDVNLKGRPSLKEFLQYIDKIVAVIFLLEMLLKWLAFGFKNYFTNAWCWLDFLIVLVSMCNLVVGLHLKIIRVFRIHLPLRAISGLKRMRVILKALRQAMPAILNVLFVCLFFWLVFAIIGVQMFGGKFYSCTDLDGNRLNSSFVPDRRTCFDMNFTWTNEKINFDSVLNAYLALFEVATCKGWINIMYDAVDSTGLDQQPEAEYSVYMYLYFVQFIIIGSFFTLTLLIGVVIYNFNEKKRKAEGSLEMFMTEDQKLYYNAMKKMESKKPIKAIPRPEFKLQEILFDLTNNKKFDITIMIFICLNMFIMAMEHYSPTPLYDTILGSLDIFFIGIFTAECVLKIFALRMYYFKKPWNVFDFVVVILSILGIIVKDLIMKYYFVTPTLLSVVSVGKVGRILRLVRFLLLSKGIQTLYFVLAKSLPDLFNIFLLHFLAMFIYAIFGMFFFMNVRHRAGIDQNFNFETFGRSMILLFQIFTFAGWDGVLHAIMDEHDCNLYEDADCGNHNIAVAYLVSYLIISLMIIILYIAVILENYSQVMEDVEEGLTEDDYDMFYEIWRNFDPDGTQFIAYSDLSTFLDSLKEPLRISKPNKQKIILMNIPICKGDLVFCVDVLDAVTKNFFQKKGHHIDELTELEVVPRDVEGYNPISTTLRKQREIYAARVLQSAWKRYKVNGKEPKGKTVQEVKH